MKGILSVVTLVIVSIIQASTSSTLSTTSEALTYQPRSLFDQTADFVAKFSDEESRNELLKLIPNISKNLEDARWAHAELTETFSPKEDVIKNIVLSPDGARLYAAYGGGIRVLDTKNHLSKITFQNNSVNETPKTFVLSSNERLYVAGITGAIIVSQRPPGKKHLIYEKTLYPSRMREDCGFRNILSLALSPDNLTLYALALVSGCRDTSKVIIEQWNTTTSKDPKEVISNLHVQGTFLNKLLVSPNNKTILIMYDTQKSDSIAHYLLLLNIDNDSGQTFPILNPIKTATFGPDGKLYFGATSGRIDFIDTTSETISSPRTHFHLRSHTIMAANGEAVTDLCVSQDNKFLFSASSDKTIKIWNIQKTYSLVSILNIMPGNPFSIKKIALTADGTTLYVAVGKSIQIWQIPTPTSTAEKNKVAEEPATCQ